MSNYSQRLRLNLTGAHSIPVKLGDGSTYDYIYLYDDGIAHPDDLEECRALLQYRRGKVWLARRHTGSA